MSNGPITIKGAKLARRSALWFDLAAVGASLGANVASAEQSVGGWLIASVAPLALFAAIGLWHQAQGLLTGWLGWIFNGGLGAIALGAGWISFGHWQKVAQSFGASPTDAIVLPLVVDGIAIIACVVVVAAGQKVAELEAEADEARATERRVEREQREAELQAQREAKETAAQAKRDADARQARLAELANAAPKPKANGSKRTVKASGRGLTKVEEKARNEANIAAYLAEHPDAKQADVAEFLSLSTKTIARSEAWKTHKASQNGHSSQITEGAAA